uniref:Glycosyltransferase n=1 Tax=viral metagenome TaxID=1070528 RepID=A0A6C0J8F2_9ZZZZ
MDITFGIITLDNQRTVYQSIQSILGQNIPRMEIIVVGNYTPPLSQRRYVRVIRFNENIKRGWITRKKNIICQQAQYDTIVLMHDYIKLDTGWYDGMLMYTGSTDFYVTKIKKPNGERYRDYLLFKADILPHTLLPYDYDSTPVAKLMYISGAYFIIKKSVALQFPLDERLCHGQGEDVDLSQRLALNGILPAFNPHSSVTLLKESYCEQLPISEEELASLDVENIFKQQCEHMVNCIYNVYCKN